MDGNHMNVKPAAFPQVYSPIYPSVI